MRLASLAILMASLPSVCASNSSMRNQLPRRPAKPLGPLTSLPVLSANFATPWRIVKGLCAADLTGLSAKPPRETTFSEFRKIGQKWPHQCVARFCKLALGKMRGGWIDTGLSHAVDASNDVCVPGILLVHRRGLRGLRRAAVGMVSPTSEESQACRFSSLHSLGLAIGLARMSGHLFYLDPVGGRDKSVNLISILLKRLDVVMTDHQNLEAKAAAGVVDDFD